MRILHPLTLTGLLLVCAVAHADDNLQEKFNRRYSTFLSRDSQTLLPLPQIDKAGWKKSWNPGR